jgi:REG-2-like HAD superfamily hydrolase
MNRKLDLAQVRGVTLDAGGTLIFPNPSVGEVYADVLAEFGIEASPEDLELRFLDRFKAERGQPRKVINDQVEREFWRAIVKDVLEPICPRNKIDDVFEAMYDTFASPDRWRLAEDVIRTITGLKLRNYQVAILSNADSRFRKVLEGLGCASIVDQLFISSEIGYEKPDERIFRFVEARMELRPTELLHVGDSYVHDYSGAVNAGWKGLLIGLEQGNEHHLANLEELLDLCQPIEQK